MFEPVQGSAPDIAGRGVANPVGQMWAASTTLNHLGEKEVATVLVAAFEAALIAESAPATRRYRFDRGVHLRWWRDTADMPRPRLDVTYAVLTGVG